MVIAATTTVLLAVAVLHDMERRVIPDWVPAALLVLALLSGCMHLPPLATSISADNARIVIPWIDRLYGGLAGTAVGLVLFYVMGFGGADAKLAIALGVLLGPWFLAVTLFWTALAGAGLGLVAAARGHEEFAYGPAFLGGFLACQIQVLVT